MPKGRGANERRRSGRQKLANRMNRIARNRNATGTAQARFEHWADARRRRIRGNRSPIGSQRVRWSISDAKSFSAGYWDKREREAKAKRKAREKWAA